MHHLWVMFVVFCGYYSNYNTYPMIQLGGSRGIAHVLSRTILEVHRVCMLFVNTVLGSGHKSARKGPKQRGFVGLYLC